MWIKIAFVVCCVVSSAWADCDQTITVTGVSTAYGNDVVNGDYVKISLDCDNHDVFNHSTNAIYLLHIDDGAVGMWIFRDDETCGDNNIDVGYVRVRDGERNPGLIQTGWEEKIGNGNWNKDNDIDVDCYEIPKCQYRIVGAKNTSLNGNYNDAGTDCQFRDVHKHENLDVYLYFQWSETQREYFWQVSDSKCADTAYKGALLQVDDYSAGPELIMDDWEEWDSTTSKYVINTEVDADCFDNDPGLSAGAIAGIVIGCLAFVALVGGLVYFCIKRD